MATATASRRYWQSARFREGALRLLIHAVLIAGGIVVMIPLYWMISTSLKPWTDVYKYPPVWIPSEIVWGNYPDTFNALPTSVFVFLANSLTLALASTLGTLLSCPIVAYSFARLRFRGSSALFIVLLSTMMLPSQVTMIPVFMLFSRIGWVNTYLPLVVPAFFGNAYFIFLLRQFFSSIPMELDDAAKLDGCSTFGTFLRIGLPLAKPALGVTAIFAFTWSWNDFMGPLIYISSTERFPLALALQIFRSLHGVQWQTLMVLSLVTLIPVLVLFFVAQKYYIQGIVITGVKG